MKNIVIELNTFVVLRRSFYFLIDFVKRYWFLIIACLLIETFYIFIDLILNNGTVTTTFYIVVLGVVQTIITVIGLVLDFLIDYYAIKMAISILKPDLDKSSKSFIKSFWQMIVASSTAALIAFPLLLFLVVPAIWWLVRTSVAM